ncbi:MAG: hypothetical protein OEZ43_14280 [Gammaproteobacteria bacterium]|nr:hypothetical protein [Gammaproteobacteria bacterium]
MNNWWKICLGLLLMANANAASAYVLAGLSSDYVQAFKDDERRGDSSGYRVGLAFLYGFDRYYAGARYKLGGDSYSGTSQGNQESQDIEIQAGYRVTPILSGFVGYRYRTQDYSRTQPSTLTSLEKLNHFGVGAAISYPLRSNLVVKGDVKAYYLTSSYSTTLLSNSGSGYSGGLSVGLVYLLKNGFNVGLTARSQLTNTGYFTGGSYLDTYAGLGLEIGKVF